MDDSDDPWVTLKFQGCPEVVRFKASGEADAIETKLMTEYQNEIEFIFDAVHKAYIVAERAFWKHTASYSEALFI